MNKKSTKKALLTSALCLLLCCSMLIGTTFAWFTDSVSSNNNIITAGNLDVNLYWSTDARNWEAVTEATNVFKTGTLWEPGHTEVVYLKVVNEGTLALKYDLIVNVASEVAGVNVAGESFNLSDYILYNVYEGIESYADSAEARGDETGDKLNKPYNKASQLLEKGEEIELTMVVFMPATVGNEANYTGATAPSINLGINLFATQFTKEEDSFGDQYDVDAPYTTVATAEDFVAAVAEGGYVKLENDIALSDILVVAKNGTVIDGNGKTLTSTAARAINISGATGVKIQNLNVVTTGERAINVIQNATDVTLDNVNATAANYTVNIASSAANAKVAIKNSTLTGLCTVNVSAEGAKVTVENSTVNCNDNNTTKGEAYAALSLNKEAVGGSIIATGTTINVTAGSDSHKGRNGAPNGTVTIDGSAEDVLVIVAVITYAGSPYYHGFSTVEEAIEFAEEGATITLIRNITDTIVMKSGITLQGSEYAVVNCINLNGADNVTLKGITFDAAGAKRGYDGAGNPKQYANIITGDLTNKPNKGAMNLVIDGCTFTGTFANSGAAIAFADQKRPGGFSGNITIKNCTFATKNAYYDIYGYYAGNETNGYGKVEILNNTFDSQFAGGGSICFFSFASNTPIVVKGNTFKSAASAGAAMYVTGQSGWTPSFAESENIYAG